MIAITTSSSTSVNPEARVVRIGRDPSSKRAARPTTRHGGVRLTLIFVTAHRKAPAENCKTFLAVLRGSNRSQRRLPELTTTTRRARRPIGILLPSILPTLSAVVFVVSSWLH
jgi:hypothetical protein